MVPINSASQFKSFLSDLKEWRNYPCFKLYAKFPNLCNSVMDYGTWYYKNGNPRMSGCSIIEYYLPYLEAGLAPYYIEELIPLEINGKVTIKERSILTYVPFDEVVFYGAELFSLEKENEFLEWRKSKATSEYK